MTKIQKVKTFVASLSISCCGFALLVSLAFLFTANYAKADLITYWTFNETTGFSDSSGNGYTGAVVGTSPTIVNEGVYGKTFYGNENGDYKIALSNANVNLNNFSVSFWCKQTGYQWKDYIGIYATDNASNYDVQFQMNPNSNSISIYGDLWNETHASADMSSGFHHVVFTTDSSTGKATMYIDNVKQAEVANTDANKIIQAISIGGDCTAINRNGTFTVDEVQVYNRPLSTDQITHLYENPNLYSATVYQRNVTANGNWSDQVWTANGQTDQPFANSSTVELTAENSPTLTVDQDVTVNSIDFTGSMTLSGDKTIKFNGEKIINIDAAADSVIITAPIDAYYDNTITKKGAGTLKLNGSKTVPCNITVENGTLQLDDQIGGNKKFTGIVTVAQGASLICNNKDTIGWGGDQTILKIYGKLENKVENETFNNTELHMYGGTASSTSTAAENAFDILNQGVKFYSYALEGASETTVSTISADLKLRHSGSFNIITDENSQLNVTGKIYTGGDSGSLTKLGPGVLAFSAANTYTNPTVISEGTLKLIGAGKLGTETVTVNSNAVLDFSESTSDSVKVTNLTGAGTVTGTNKNLELTNSADSSFTGTINIGNGTITKTGDKVLTLNGPQSIPNNVTISEGSLKLDYKIGDSKKFTGEVTIADSAVLICNIQDAIGYKNNSGYETVLRIYGELRNTSGNETLANTELHMYGGKMTTTASQFDILKTSVKLYSHVNENSQTTGPTVSTISAPLLLRNHETGNFDIQTDANTKLVITNKIYTESGSGVLTIQKLGSGVLEYTYNNTYSGGTIIDNGTIKLTGEGSLGTGFVTMNSNAIIDFTESTSENVQLNNLTGSGTITGNNQNLVLSVPAESSYTGTIDIGTGSITKNGDGSLIPTSIAYTGDTTIGGGVFKLAGDNLLGSGSVTVNGTLDLTEYSQNSVQLKNLAGSGTVSLTNRDVTLYNSEDSIFSGTISNGTGTITKTGDYTLSLTGSQSFSNNITISEGTLQIDYKIDGSKKFTGEVTIEEDATLLCTKKDSLGWGSASTTLKIYGTLKNTVGNETFNNIKLHFYGGTASSEVQSGEYQFDILNANVEIKSFSVTGATVEKPTISKIDAPLKIRDNITNTFSITTEDKSQLILSGVIYNDTGDSKYCKIKKLGPGVLELSGANTYQGGTIVDAGKLLVTGNGTLGTGATSVSQNATLEFNVNQGTAKTVQNISGLGKVLKTGNGTLRINNDNSSPDLEYGNVVAQAGRLDMKGLYTGSLEIAPSAIFSPGNSVGTVTINDFVLNNGATLFFEVGKNEQGDTVIDRLNVNNNATFVSGSIVEIGLDEHYSLQGGETVSGVIITNSNAEGIFNDVQSAIRSYYFTDIELTHDANNIYFRGTLDPNAVPEPSTWALLILGAAGLLYWRKKNS